MKTPHAELRLASSLHALARFLPDTSTANVDVG